MSYEQLALLHTRLQEGAKVTLTHDDGKYTATLLHGEGEDEEVAAQSTSDHALDALIDLSNLV